MVIVKLNIKDLQIHPENERIYGETEADQELVDSIRENGLLSRIVVDQDKQIISGARRYLALSHLIDEGIAEYKTIEVFQKPFNDANELVSFIIESNLSREKTWVQKVREGWAIHDSVKKQARYDQFKSLINVEIVPEKIPERKDGEDEKGETYDRVARRVGLPNGKAYYKYSKVLEAADGLQLDENPDHKSHAVRLKELAGLSLSAAETVVKERKFELLMETPDDSKKAVGEFKKSKTPTPAEGSFSKGTWIKKVKDQLKEVLELFKKDKQTYDSLCEELDGELLFDDAEDGVRVTLELKLS